MFAIQVSKSLVEFRLAFVDCDFVLYLLESSEAVDEVPLRNLMHSVKNISSPAKHNISIDMCAISVSSNFHRGILVIASPVWDYIDCQAEALYFGGRDSKHKKCTLRLHQAPLLDKSP